MKVFITGSHGYIGSKLKQSFRDPIECDLKAGKDIRSYYPQRFEVLYHLAGQADIPASMEDPENDATQNILGTLAAIRLANRSNAKLIFSSSAAALDPQSPYGLAKKTAEEYIKLLCREYVILRFSSIYGGKPTGVVDNFIRDEVCTINGKGTAIRDFVHIDDIIKCLLQAKYWQTGTYNCGSGEGVSVKQLALATGKKIKYKPEIKGEIEKSILPNDTPTWEPEKGVISYIQSTLQPKKENTEPRQ